MCSYAKIFKHPLIRRKIIANSLGLLFGLLGVYIISYKVPDIWGWDSPLMWIVLINRVIIGITITMAGAFTQFLLLPIRLIPFLRGGVMGAVVSLQIAFGVFLSTELLFDKAHYAFWVFILLGAVYGSIIDWCATIFGGEGEELLKPLKL